MSQRPAAEADVVEYLDGIGRGEIAERALQAMSSLTSDSSSWLSELQSMESDGMLDEFLDACAADVQQELPEASAKLGSDGSPGDDVSDSSGSSSPRAVDAGSSSAPSASPIKADEVEESIETAVELAAEVALKGGGVAEEMFSVSLTNGKKKLREGQLKVGQMSLQLFQAGTLINSWRYPDLGGWSFTSERHEETGTLVLQMGPNKKKGDEDLEFVCSSEVGERCCELMKQHATVMHEEEKRQMEAERKKQREDKEQRLRALRGEYTVSPHCLLLRKTAALDSPKIGIVDSGEAVSVVDAVIVDGRTRVHVVGNEVRMRESDEQKMTIEGWGSWRSSMGTNLLLERLPRKAQRESLKGTALGGGGAMQHWLGEYVIEQAGGLRVHATEALESAELCTIAPEERVQAVEAKFVGERLRLRIKDESVKLVAEPEQPNSGAVDGWVSLRDTAGSSLLKKVELAVGVGKTQEHDTDYDDGQEEASDDDTTGNDAGDSVPPIVSSLDLRGSIQDQIEDVLSPTCQDIHSINQVLERAAAKNYSHPSVKALQMKALSLDEQAQQESGSPRPAASASMTQRRMSVAQEGVNSVVDLAAQAATVSGHVPEKIFNVTITRGRKKSVEQRVQLKISQMGAQVFDGPKLLESFLYANLSAWEFIAGKRVLVLVIADNSSVTKTREFGCTRSVGVDICTLMTDHARAMAKQQRSELKQRLLDLRGKYTVTTPNGVLMRMHASQESSKVGIVANSEELDVVNAVLAGGRTRLHATGSNVCMDDGTVQDVDGWISLKNATGTPLVEKADDLVRGISPSQSPQLAPPKPSRLQSLRRHSVAVGASSFSGPASPRQKNANSPTKSGPCADPILEIDAKQTHLQHAAEQVVLRCEPLALCMMDGSRCVSTIKYSTLAAWQVVPSPMRSEPHQLELVRVNGETVTFQCVLPGDAEKVSLAMTKHAKQLAQQRSKSLSPGVQKSSRMHTGIERYRSAEDKTRGLNAHRRASVAIGSSMNVVPRGRKAFIKNSAFTKKTDDGENSFVAKQTSPKIRDVMLTLHNFGLQISAHPVAERPVTYSYDRMLSWKTLPNGDLCLKCLSTEGDLEILNFTTGDAQTITALLSQFSGADPTTPTALQHETNEEVVEPGNRYECINTCSVTAEWERTSAQTGQVEVGQVMEVAEATINHQKQWRAKISRAWNDKTCTELLPSLQSGWVSIKQVSGEPNFLSLQTEQEQPAHSSLTETESAFWRETRLLQEAEQRARHASASGDSLKAIVEPIRMAKKIKKPSRSSTERLSETSDISARPSVSDSQDLDDPVSPRFLQDAASAVAAIDSWPADEKLRLQEQHALQLAEQQRKIASLEMQILDLNAQVATKSSHDSNASNLAPADVQTELMNARQQACDALREKEKVEQERGEIEKHAVEQLAKMRALEEQIKMLDSRLESDSSKGSRNEIDGEIETATDATQRTVAAKKRAELAETKLAHAHQENQQLRASVAEHKQQLHSMAKQHDAWKLGNADRVAELEAGRIFHEGCVATLSRELDHATAAMEIHFGIVSQLAAAHDAAIDKIGVLEQQKEQLEKHVADQGYHIRDLESQKHELEHVRLQHHVAQDQHQLETVQHLKAKVSSLEAKVTDEQASQVALRRDNAELKTQMQALRMAHKAHPSEDIASDETARAEITSLEIKLHEACLEGEALRIELARNKRLVAESEIREAKSHAQIAEAHGRTSLLEQQLQVTKTELHAQRATVGKLNDQLAELDAVDSRAVTLQQELETLRAEHTGLHDQLQTEVALRKQLKGDNEKLNRDISAGQEARKRLEDEAQAGWDKANVEARLRKDAMDDKRTKVSELQAKVDDLTRNMKKQQSLLDVTMQRHEEAQRKLKAETERSHAAELNAQHVASRARAASAEMRSNMVDIQRRYEQQLAAVRAEKAEIEVAHDQAIQERQRIQEWVHEHMAATQERLLNSSAAVDASEKVRVQLQPRLEKSESEVRRLKDELRRQAQEAAVAQQQTTSQLEHLKSVSQTERGRLEAQLDGMSTDLEEQRKQTAAERDRREASERRVESELEAARVAEQNTVYAIQDAKAELGTALEHAKLEMSRTHREEVESLRLENAKLKGQLEHSNRAKSQLQAQIGKLEAQQLLESATASREQPAAAATTQLAATVTSSSMRSDIEVRKAQAHLQELQERHALQMSEWRTSSRETQIEETARFASISSRYSTTPLSEPNTPLFQSTGAAVTDSPATPSEGVPPLAIAHQSLALASGCGDVSSDAAVQENARAAQRNIQIAEDFSKRMDFLMDSLVNNLSPQTQNSVREDATRNTSTME